MFWLSGLTSVVADLSVHRAFFNPPRISIIREVMSSSQARMVIDQGADDSNPAVFTPTWSSEPVVDLSQEMLAILEEAGVSERFKEFCRKC